MYNNFDSSAVLSAQGLKSHLCFALEQKVSRVEAF